MGKITGVKDVRIDDLKPYKGNAKKHSERQIEALMKSIEQFGFVSPCLIDKDMNIIAGHGRAESATRLGMKKIPCVFVEGLTEEQRRAYILADNKLSELGGGWDKGIIAEELATLELDGFDIDITGFDLDRITRDLDEMQNHDYYGDERERTNKAYNMDIIDYDAMTNDFWEMPIIENDNFIPSDLIGFNYAKTSKNKKAGIHFYIDDYQFERVWNYPDKYIDILKQYECILSPDFSLYTDMPMPIKIWNIYRSRQIGSYYQSKGIKVIPTISWADDRTFEFCFQGIPEGSIVSVSTIGVKDSDYAMGIWKSGMYEMIEQIKPTHIILYGGMVDFDYGNIEVIEFGNKVTESWSKRKND